MTKIIFTLVFNFIYLQAFSQVEPKLVEGYENAIKREQSSYQFIFIKDIVYLSPLDIGALLALQFYKSYISSDLGSSCMFEPSCSVFSATAIREKGFFFGLLLTADRLIRCNPEAYYDNCKHLIDPNSGKIRDEIFSY